MTKEIGKYLKVEKIQSLGYREPLCVKGADPIDQVIEKMCDQKIGSALIEENGKLVGIFTERDIMTRVVGPALSLKTPIQKVMTPNPKTLKADDSVAIAIRKMCEGRYRHIPLVDSKGKITGILSVRQLVRFLSEHFPNQVINLPPNLHQVQQSKEGA